jgi:hypothetical protein
MDLKKNQNSMYRVHGFEEKTKYHVPGYMDLKKKQNIMYPVHGFEEKNKKSCTPGYMNLKKKFLCVAQGVGEARRNFFFFFWQFFSTCEKINQFLRCCQYQGGKI